VVRRLRTELGLEIRCFGILEPSHRPEPPRPPEPAGPAQVRPTVPANIRARDPVPRLRDYSRTRVEARSFYRVEEEPPATRRFSLLDITSGLPDDSREADERGTERRLRDLRGRVEAARTVIARTPGLFEWLALGQGKAVPFCSGYGITARMLVQGVEAGDVDAHDMVDVLARVEDSLSEVRQHERAVLPKQ
jgi:hypothetical protein